MLDLQDFLHKLSNPLRIDLIYRFVETYNDSVMDNSQSLYTKWVSSDEPQNYDEVKLLSDVSSFQNGLYQMWRESILKIKPNQINAFCSRYGEYFAEHSKNFKELQELLSSHKMSSNLMANLMESKYSQFVPIYDNHFLWVDSFSILPTSAKKERDVVEARLYFNIPIDNRIAFASLFVKQCMKNNLDFYFKFDCFNSREDAVVLYVNRDNMMDTIQVLQKMKKSNRKLFDSFGAPPKFSSVFLDGKCGFGEEPVVTDKSFNGIRIKALGKAMEDSYKDYYLNNYLTRDKNSRTLASKLASYQINHLYEQAEKMPPSIRAELGELFGVDFDAQGQQLQEERNKVFQEMSKFNKTTLVDQLKNDEEITFSYDVARNLKNIKVEPLSFTKLMAMTYNEGGIYWPQFELYLNKNIGKCLYYAGIDTKNFAFNLLGLMDKDEKTRG